MCKAADSSAELWGVVDVVMAGPRGFVFLLYCPCVDKLAPLETRSLYLIPLVRNNLLLVTNKEWRIKK